MPAINIITIQQDITGTIVAYGNELHISPVNSDSPDYPKAREAVTEAAIVAFNKEIDKYTDSIPTQEFRAAIIKGQITLSTQSGHVTILINECVQHPVKI